MGTTWNGAVGSDLYAKGRGDGVGGRTGQDEDKNRSPVVWFLGIGEVLQHEQGHANSGVGSI